MSVHELLAEVGAAGVTLWLDEQGALRYRAPKGVMTAAIARRLADHKDAVIGFLKAAVQSRAADQRIVPIPRAQHLPLSFTQQRLWVTQQIDPAATAYNVPIRLRLTGPLDVAALTRAFERAVARHEVLRTVYVEVEGGPMAVIQPPPSPWPMPVLDVRRDPSPQEAVSRELAREVMTPFHLATGPLMRAVLIRESDLSHVLALTLHHIVIDADAAAVLVGEVLAFYREEITGQSCALPELSAQYVDFAAWQRRMLESDLFAGQIAYWRRQLADAPAHLSLPTDFPRRSDGPALGRLFLFEMDAATQKRLREVCRDGAFTPFMVLLAAYQVLLARYAGATDVCVGVPISGQAHLQAERLIGCFLNVLVMRAKLGDNPSTRELLQQVRRTTLEAFDHQDVPFDMVVDALGMRRGAGRQLSVQVGFTYRAGLDTKDAVRAIGGEQLGGLEVEYLPLTDVTAKYDLILGVSEGTGALEGAIEYRTDLFSAQTIARFADHFRCLLTQMLADPDRRLSQIALRTEDDIKHLLALDAGAVERIAPLSPPQRDIWLAHVRNPQGVENCLGWAVRFDAPLDFGRWRNAVEAVTARFTALRTRIHDCHAPLAEPAYQVVYTPGWTPVALEEWTVPGDDGAAVRELLERHVYRPFDLAKESLVRHGLVRVGAGGSVAFVAAHHLALDGHALAELMNQLCAEYDRLTDGGAVSGAAEPDLYPDYLDAAASAYDSTATLDFWRGRVQSCEALEISARGRAAAGCAVSPARACEWVVPSEHVAAVRALCRVAGVTPALYWKVVYALTLGVYADARADFHIQEVVAGRPKGHGRSIGNYFGQLPFVVPGELYAGATEIQSLLRHAAEDRRERAAHENLSLLAQSHLLPGASRRWLYNFYNFPESHALGGTTGTPIHFPPPVGDEVALVVKALEGATRLSLQHPDGALDGEAFLRRMLVCSEAVVGAQGRIGPDVFLTAPEAARLDRWGTGSRHVAHAASVAEWLEQGLRRHAHRVAVVCGDRALTCGELDALSTQYAHGLLAAGAVPGQPVAVGLEPGPDLLVAIYGAVKAGVPYIPLDGAHPAQRVRQILDDSGCALLIGHPAAAGGTWGGQVRSVAEVLHAGAAAHAQAPAPPRPDSPLYLIYTSGSTGRPKGAGVTHAGAVNLLEWYAGELAIGPGDRALLGSAIGFDLTQKNLFAVPASGATLVVPTRGLPLGPALVDAVAADRITLLNCAPSVFYSAAESDADLAGLASLRALVLGGESVNVARLAAWTQRPDFACRILNSYGPTECTDVVSAFDLRDPREWLEQAPPIGGPLPNVRLQIVDRGLRRIPPGLAGELLVAGRCVGTGYWRDEALSTQKFVTDPAGGGRAYRTGDRARWSPSGQLEFVGRTDFQVKVRGVRIEPGDVESALRGLPGVRDALAVGVDARLVAYVVTPAGEAPEGWRERLRERLPAHMLPDLLVPLAAWPLGVNGKVDRHALPVPEVGARTHPPRPPRDALEAALAELVAGVLRVDEVGVDDDFFALGGDSLMAVQIAARVGARFEVELTARVLFERPTVEGLAAHVRRLQARDAVLWDDRDEHARPEVGAGYEELAF